MTPRMAPMMVRMPLAIELRKRRRPASAVDVSIGTLISSAEGIS
jgi:hypothetical protein